MIPHNPGPGIQCQTDVPPYSRASADFRSFLSPSCGAAPVFITAALPTVTHFLPDIGYHLVAVLSYTMAHGNKKV